jgi:hypothetical protein
LVDVGLGVGAIVAVGFDDGIGALVDVGATVGATVGAVDGFAVDEGATEAPETSGDGVAEEPVLGLEAGHAVNVTAIRDDSKIPEYILFILKSSFTCKIYYFSKIFITNTLYFNNIYTTKSILKNFNILS